MVTERIETTEQTIVPDFTERIIGKYSISKQALEKIITLQPTDPDYPLSSSFEDNYQASNNSEMKYAIARALIADGRYSNTPWLVRKFLAPGQEVAPEIKQLKGNLQFHLVKEGRVDINSGEAKEAEDEVLGYVDRSELLKKLRQVLPIHVMGAITNALLFEDVTDEKKKEKLRSFTTRALIRPYLGDLLVQRPLGEIDFRDLVVMVPEKVFKNADTATLGIVRNHLVSEAMRLFINNEEEGFRSLSVSTLTETSPVKREFLEKVEREFHEIAEVQIPPVFYSEVEGWFADKSPFPLFRQKYFVYEFLRSRRSFLNGDTGATKTACAYLGMETIGAQRVTIFGPAKARNTWPREAEKIFLDEHRPDVFAVRRFKDLEDPRVETAKYVYVGSELLGGAWNNPQLYGRIQKALLEKRQTDGLIFDESDEFCHSGANCTKMLVDLVKKMHEGYRQRNVFEMPSIALTATPISSSLEDMDITMALLYPDKFSLPRQKGDGVYPFSIQALRDPKLAYFLLQGEGLMIQWSLEDLFGEKAPKLKFGPENRISIATSPTQEIIYEWAAGLQIGTLAKIRLLRAVLLNPELIKRACQERNLIPEPVYSKEGLVEKFHELHEAWMKWTIDKDGRIPYEKFSTDWIAKYGDRDLLLQCFFDDKLIDGVESLSRRYPEIYSDWQTQDTVSGKYSALKRFLQERIVRNGDGSYHAREKVFVVSPYHKRGITRWLDDPNTKDEDLEDNAWSLYEYMHMDWLPDLPADMAINIDGTRSFTARDRAAGFFREYGNKNALVIASMDSVNESMDWAIRDTESNRNIERLSVVFLGWPFGFDEFKQMTGRFLRPGQSKPVDIYVYEGENSIDQGFFNLVRVKHLLTQMALAGVNLSPEDQEFFKSSTSAKRILLAQPNVGQAFLRDVVKRMAGLGEREAAGELSKDKDGKTYEQLFAEFYFDEGKDEFRIVGNNAELAKNILFRTNPRRILSIGAGTCLFARKVTGSGYTAEIENLDINGAALRIAKERFPSIGQIKIEGASNISSESARYDAIDCSFMLPWTRIYGENGKAEGVTQNERVKIMLEMNRVLKFGGTTVLTFPESSFDTTTFERFTKTVASHFGFSILEPSGTSYATDLKPSKRIGWVITLQKIGEPQLSGLQPGNLAFLSDETKRVSKYRAGKNGGEPVVVNVEYPIFSSKEFEVRNPLTGEISLANSPTARTDLFISARDLVEKVKSGLSAEQWQVWSAARRDIEQRLDRNYEDAEEILVGILRRRGLDNQREWNADILVRLVSGEVQRILRREVKD